jgi:hypothetical protein
MGCDAPLKHTEYAGMWPTAHHQEPTAPSYGRREAVRVLAHGDEREAAKTLSTARQFRQRA